MNMENNKVIKWLINDGLNFALHRRVYSTIYPVLSEYLWKKLSQATRAGLEPTASCLLVQTS